MVLIYEHLLQSHRVPSLIEFLELAKHLIHFANSFISENLVLIKLPVNELIRIFFLVLEVKAGVDDVLACQSFDLVGVLLFSVYLCFVIVVVERDFGVVSRQFGGRSD